LARTPAGFRLDRGASQGVCLFAAGHLLPAGDFSPLLMFRLHFSHPFLA
jgi:hypothetical protein